MDFLFEEFTVNINSVGTFSAIVVLIIFVLFFLIFRLSFHRLPVLNYAIFIVIIMLAYMIVFLMLINASAPYYIFVYSRLLYAIFMVLAASTITVVCRMTHKKSLLPDILAGIMALIIIALIYGSDTLIITREIQIGSYAGAVKGPYYPLMQLFLFIINLYLITDIVRLYLKKDPALIDTWQIYIGVIFYALYTFYLSFIISINPFVKPSLYVNTLLFSFLLIAFAFKKIKGTILEKEALYLAYLMDDLTKLYSRNYLLEQISDLLNQRRLSHYYVAMIDIDGFKKINDLYGHHIGDLVLREFGKLLNAFPRDRVISGRLGGDEFITLFKDVSRDKVHQLLTSLMKDYVFAINKMNIDLLKTETGLSIGYIKIDERMKITDVLSGSDESMYKAKKNGKNSLYFNDRATER